jgi:hypothetical protein
MSELKAVQHLRQSQQHTARSSMNLTLTLMAKLFCQTPALKTSVDHVKRTVFGVTDGEPILAEDHPV